MEQKFFVGHVFKSSCILKNEDMDHEEITSKDVKWIICINEMQDKKLIFETSQLVEAHETTACKDNFPTNIFEIGEKRNTKGYQKIQKKQKLNNKNKPSSSRYCSFVNHKVYSDNNVEKI